jgi:hypothetical protein
MWSWWNRIKIRCSVKKEEIVKEEKKIVKEEKKEEIVKEEEKKIVKKEKTIFITIKLKHVLRHHLFATDDLEKSKIRIGNQYSIQITSNYLVFVFLEDGQMTSVEIKKDDIMKSPRIGGDNYIIINSEKM